MRILLTGGTGQVGWELRRSLAPLGEVVAPGRAELDLAVEGAAADAVRDVAPDVVVNAAGWTDVDGAEAEPGRAAAVNARAPGELAEAAARIGARMVHYSTDYVFDGEKGAPYAEEDEPGPVNAYGRTKLEGERAVSAAGAGHLVLRTSWVYGLRRSNLLTTVLGLLAGDEPLRMVDDEIGSPTWARLVAEATAAILARGGDALPVGTLHLTAAGGCTRRDFAAAVREALVEAGAAGPGGDGLPPVEPIAAADWAREHPETADRPPRSDLSVRRAEAAAGLDLPGWREALALCLEPLLEDRGPGRRWAERLGLEDTPVDGNAS